MLLVASSPCDYISRSCNVQCTWITVRDRDLRRRASRLYCVWKALMKFSFTLVNWRSAASVQIPTSHWRVVVDIICLGVPAAARSACDLCWTCGHLVSSFPAPSPCRTLCFCDERLTVLWNTGAYLLYCVYSCIFLYVSIAVFLCYFILDSVGVCTVGWLITGRYS